MNHGSLFTGIGGFDLAAEWMGWENIFHCEWNEFGQKVLNHYGSKAECFTDITKSDFTKYANRIDVLTGGFPCQDASIAKQHGEGQQGLQGERTGLFYEMCRAIREIKPKFVVAENVSNLLEVNGGADFRSILTELARMGYNAEWRTCYASEVGSPTKRKRLYIVAYPMHIRLQKGQTFFSYVYQEASQIGWQFAGTTIQTFRGGYWTSEPPAICVVNGVPNKLPGFSDSQWRKEQLKAYGNAVIPQIAFQIFKAIQLYKNKN
jgi:DNA (cytosine-5)-methyltransferase 1